MTCIACNSTQEKLVESHVISKFIRNRLTSYLDSKGEKRYRFTWVNREGLPTQDLPKPYLMCKSCDNKLGSDVEEKVPVLLIPNHINKFTEWEKLPIEAKAIDGVFPTTLWLGEYRYQESESNILNRFSISIAWRALHEMSKTGGLCSRRFLESERGQKLNNLARNFIFRNSSRGILPLAFLYYMGPNTPKLITGSDIDIPFAWTELGSSNEFLGVSVIMGHWIILWPLFELHIDTYFEKMVLLEKACFIEWVGFLKSKIHI